MARKPYGTISIQLGLSLLFAAESSAVALPNIGVEHHLCGNYRSLPQNQFDAVQAWLDVESTSTSHLSRTSLVLVGVLPQR